MSTETDVGMQDANQSAMSGGLPDMSIPEVTEAPAETIVTPSEVKNQKIVVGNKLFDSAEEALAYANGLAEAQGKAVSALSRSSEPQAQETPPKVKLGQLLFENPDEAIEQVLALADQRAEAKRSAVDQNKKFWENFYSKHADLKESELLVDAVLAREQALGTMATLSREEAAPILAAKARAEISKIRNVPSGGQALPSKPAMVAGASGASTPQAAVKKPVATNFVAELQSLRKRG